MGGVVKAIGSAVGAVADAVGDVVETAVDVAGDVLESVASNPILLAAAVASPYALSAMSTSAAAGTGISLSGASLGSGLTFAPTLGAMGSPGVVLSGLGAGASTMGISAGAIASAAAGTALGGSTFGVGSMIDPFNFPSLNQATNFGKSILDATDDVLTAFTEKQTAASTIMGNSPSYVFDASPVNTNIFSQAKQASSLLDSSNLSFTDAVSKASGGSVVPNNSTSFFSNAWDSAKGLVKTAENISQSVDDFMGQIGKTIAPNADPMVQRAVTNFGTNMVTSGGDIEQSLKSSAIGPIAGLAGKEVTSLADDALGAFGARTLGGAASNVTGALLSGATPEQALMGAGIGATGTTVTNLTGSPLIGGAARTAVGSALSGRDVGQSLLGYGINVGVDKLSDQLVDATGIPTTGFVGRITRPIIGSLEDQLRSSIMPSRPSNVQQAARPTNVSPLNTASLTKVLQSKPLSATNQSTVQPSGVLPTGAPAQKVDVSQLKPVDISTLGLKIQQRTNHGN